MTSAPKSPRIWPHRRPRSVVRSSTRHELNMMRFTPLAFSTSRVCLSAIHTAMLTRDFPTRDFPMASCLASTTRTSIPGYRETREAAAKCDMVRHAGLAAVCHLNDHTPAGYRCHIVIVSSGRSRRGIAVMAASAASYFSRESVVESLAQMGPTAETAPGLQGASGNKIPIKSPRFYAFLAAQFLGAANDNAFKITLVLFVLSVLFFTATHSSFFSPAKYGILPEVFVDKDLPVANGVLELTTDLAILIGSIAGVYAYSLFRPNLAHAGLVFLAVACIGTVATVFVPRAPAGNRDARFVWNVFDSFRADLAEVSRVPALYYTVLGIAWFGFLGSFFLTVIPVFGENVLGLSEERVGLLLATLSIGVGIGSVVAGRLSRNHVELGLVPLGSVGITLFALLGFASGFFIIPLNAMLQERAPAGMKGRLIAFSNVLTFSAVLIAAAVPWLLTSILGFTVRQVILFVALLTLVGTVYVVRMLPDFLVRLVLWLATNTIYRIRTVGEGNVPKEGALLVANHVSWVDAMLVAASSDRMVRFLMYRPYYETKGLNWFFRMMHAIPVAANDPPDQIAQSLAMAREEIQHGHVVCIFAEGSITRTGNLLRFRRGLERIASGVDCPIVPVYLDGVWGSIFSFDRGRFIFKRPKRLFEPVTVFFGPPMPSATRASEVRQAMQELSVEAFRSHKDVQRPIHLGFVRRAKRRWRGVLAVDADGSRITFGSALTRALAASRMFRNDASVTGDRIGILMPPGIDAMVANFAVYFAGHVPVNLDASEPGDLARFMIKNAGITRVITSRKFADKLSFSGQLGSARSDYFDDAIRSVGSIPLAMLKAACFVMPAGMIVRAFVKGGVRDVDQVATILYSYPPESPGTPRGAMLTHHNLLSNLESLRQVFHVTREDCILGLVPFSNSMSFTGTLVLPALTGARVAYGADLIGKRELGALCRAQHVTLIPAAAALLSAILNDVAADDLKDLRFVAVGGDDLEDGVRERFAGKFGVEPLEGYGCPECAPIVSLNIPDYARGAHRQPGMRRGTEGHPLPGISVRIVDPKTNARLPQGAEGMLLIRGPNVMSGYVNGPELTGKVLVDGWYVTGDTASVDADGFLKIKRRQIASPAV